MLHYNRIYLSEGIDLPWATMGSNFEVLSVMVVMIQRYNVLILVTVLLLLLKVLLAILLFMTLPNSFVRKFCFLFLMVVGIYKIYTKKINIKGQVPPPPPPPSKKKKKSRNILIDKKSYLNLAIFLLDIILINQQQ